MKNFLQYLDHLKEQNQEIGKPEIEAALSHICVDASDISGADLASFWLYDNNQKAIVCSYAHDATSDRDLAGVVLSEADFPAYFNEINEYSGVIANDAVNNSATKEFAEGYFDAYGIVSLLDFIIRDGEGEPVAVICCENRHEKKQWSDKDLNNLRSLATVVQYHFKDIDWLDHLKS